MLFIWFLDSIEARMVRGGRQRLGLFMNIILYPDRFWLSNLNFILLIRLPSWSIRGAF